MTKTTANLAKATLALLAATALTSVDVKAQTTTTWLTNAAGTNLSAGANWTGGSAPSNNTAWVFGSTLNAFLNNDFVPNWTNAGITFSAGAPAYTISGNALTLGGNITNSSVNTDIFNTPLTLSAARTVTTTNTGGNLVFNGAIGGNYALTVGGSGLTYLNTANTFSALTFQAGSTVVAKNTNAFGAGGINLANSVNGATIFLATDVSDNFGNNLGGLNAGGGTVKLVSDRNTVGSGVTHTLGNMTNNPGSTTDVIALKGGNVTSGSAMIGLGTVTGGSAAGGSLVLMPISAGLQIGSIAWTAPTANSTGTLFLAGSTASNTLGGTISNTISGSFTSTNSLEKDGPSTWTLNGSNSATGTSKVSGGTLVLDYGTNGGAKLPSGVLTLNGGSIQLKGGSNATVENVASTTLLAGMNRITTSGATPNRLQLKALTLTGGALDILTAGIATTTSAIQANGTLGGRVTVGGADYATTNASGIVAYSNYTALPSSGSATTTVYSLNGGTNITSLAVGSLKITSAIGTPQKLEIGGSNSTVFSSYNGGGSILYTGSDDYTINATNTGAKFNNTVTIVQQYGTGLFTINGNIAQGLELYGTGTMSLGGINTTNFTSATTVAGASLIITNNASLSAAASNGIAYTAGLTLNSGGKLIADTRSGNVTMDNGGGTNANRAITIGLGGGGLDVIGNGTFTVSGVILNAVAANYGAPLVLGSSNSTGTIQLTALNTFTGGVSLNGGTVLLGNSNTVTNITAPVVSYTAGSTTVTLMLSATNGSATNTGQLRVGQAITGASAVANTIITSIVDSTHFTISTPATATSASNTIGIAAGDVLGVYNNVNSGQNFNYITFNGGTLKYSSNNNTDYSSRFALDANQKFNIDTAGRNVTFATGLSGAGSVLTKMGDGTLTLAGPAAVVPYSGGTVINGGAVKLANPTAITTGPLTLADGTLFDLGGNPATVSAITATAAGLISNSSTNAVLTVSNTDNATISATLGGSALGVSKAGTGTLTLAGNNSYAGPTTVNAGQLVVPSGNGLTNSTVTVGAAGSLVLQTNSIVAGITNNGSLSGSGKAGDVTLNAGSTITSGGESGITSGSLSFSNLFITGGTYNWNLQTSSNSLADAYDQIKVKNQVTFSSSLSNSPFLINFITNGTTIWDTSTQYNTVNTYNIITAGSITGFNRKFFKINNQPDPTLGSFSVGANSNNIFLTFSRPGSTIQLFADYGQSILQNDADTKSQLPGGGASTPIIISGGGEIVMDQSNDFSGSVVIGSGTLTAANTGALASDNINLGTASNGGSNSVLNFNSNAVGTVSSANIKVVGTGTNSIQNSSGGLVNLSGAVSLSNNVNLSTISSTENLQLSGPVTGSGAVAIAGPGVVTLTGTNTYGGGSTLNGSTLAVAGPSALGTGTLAVLTSSKLQAAGSGTLANPISVADGSRLSLDAAGFGLEASGPISGNASVSITNSTGSGAITLSGANSYTGGTTLNGGSLILTRADALGTGTLTVNSSGGTLKQTAAQILARTIALGTNNLTFDLGNTALTPTADLTGSGTITVNNSGGLTFVQPTGFTGTMNVNSGNITVNTNVSVTNMSVGVSGAGVLYNYGQMGSVTIGGNGNANNANGTIVPGTVNAYASNASFAGPVTIAGPSAGKIVPVANNVPNNTVYNGPATLTLSSSNIILPLSASNSIKVGDTIDGGFSTKGGTIITSITTNSSNLIVNLSGALKNTNLPGITTGTVQFYRLDGTSQLVGTNYGYAQLSGTATSGVTATSMTVDGRLDILTGQHNLTGITGTANPLQSNYVGGGSGGILYSSTVSNNLGFAAGGAFASFIFTSNNSPVVGLTQSGTGTTYFGMFGENQATNASATFNGGNWAIGQVGQDNGGEHGSATITLTNNAQITLGGNVFSSGPANIGGTAYTTGVFNVNQGKITSLGDLETLACDFGTTKSLSAYMQMNVATNGALDVQGKMQLGNNVVGSNGGTGTVTSPNGNSLNINGGLVNISKGLIFGADTSLNTWGGGTVNDRNSVTLGSGTLSVGSDGIMMGYVGTNVIVNSVARTVTDNQNTLTVSGGKLVVAGAISATDSNWLTGGSTVTNSFVWNGGQVTALTINASNTTWNGASSSIKGNTLYNSNGTLAPGDLGTAGLTTINGNYVQSGVGAALALDVGGGNQANGFTVSQDNGGASDYLKVSGAATFSNTTIVLNPNWYTLAGGNSTIALVGASSLSATNITYLWSSGKASVSPDNTIALSATNVGNAIVANVTFLNQWTNGQGNWGSGRTAVWTRGVDTTNGASSFAAFGSKGVVNLDQNETVHALSFQGSDNVISTTNASQLTLASPDAKGVVLNNNTSGTNTLGVSVVLNDNLLMLGNGYLNLSGGVAGSNGVTSAGSSNGVMALTGSNSYSGPTLVSSGALQTTFNPNTAYTVSSGANLIAILGGDNGWSESSLIAQAAGMRNSALSFDASGTNYTVGAGIFTNGAASLTLGTYGNGTVSLASDTDYSAVRGYIVNGGTLDLGATNRGATAGTVLTSGSITNGTLASSVNFNGNGSGAISAVIADNQGTPSSVSVTGKGSLLLNGANSFSGGVNVLSGILSINDQAALGAGTTTVNGGTFDLNASTIQATNGLLNLASGTIRGGTINLNGNYQALTNGTISAGLSGNGGLEVNNAAAKLVISGYNDYSGDTRLTAGTLQTTLNGNTAYVVTNAGTTLIASIGTVQPWDAGKIAQVAATMTNSTIGIDASGSDSPFTLTNLANGKGGVILRNYGTGTLVLPNGGDFSGVSQLSVSGGVVDLGAGTLTPLGTYGTNLFLGGGVLTNGVIVATNSIYASVGSTVPAIAAVDLSGSAGLSKWGAGTLILSGNNSFSGGTAVNNGTVLASSATALGTGAVSVNGTGTLDLGGNTLDADSQPLTISSGLLTGGSISVNGSLTNVLGGTIAATVQGSGTLLKRGSGTLTLSSSNGYTGGTVVSAGSLVMANASAIGSGSVSIGGGTLDLGTYGLNADNQPLTMTAGVLTNGSVAADNALTNLSGGTIAASISGTASLVKGGGGTLTLASANTYTGGTVVNAGALVMGNAAALGSGSVTVSGGALNIGGNTVNLDSQSVSLTSGSITNGTVSSATAFDSLGNGTVSASLIGVGSLTHASGTLTLSGNNGYTGGTYVNGGVLALGSTTANGTGSLAVRGGILDLGGLTFNLTSLNATLSTGTIRNGMITGSTDFSGLAAGSGTVSAALAGSGSLVIGSSSTLTLSGSNNLWNGRGYLDGGTLVLGSSNAIGTGGFLIRSNSVLSASTNIAATGALSVTNGVGLTVNAAGKSLVISGGVSGAGNLTVASSTGTGTVVLTGSNNTLSGNFTVAGNGNTNTGSAGNATFVASNATLPANFIIAAPSTAKSIAFAAPNMPAGSVGTNYGYALFSGGVTATNVVVNGRLDIATGSNSLSGITGTPNGNTNFVGGGSGAIVYSSTNSNSLGFAAGGAFSGFYLGSNAVASLTQSGTGTTSFGVFGQPAGNTGALMPVGSAVTFSGGKWAIGQFGQNNSYQIAAGTFTLDSNAAITVGGNTGAGGTGYTHGTFNVNSGSLTFNGSTSQSGGGVAGLANTLSLNVGGNGTLTVNGVLQLGVTQSGSVVSPSSLTNNGGKANLTGIYMGNAVSAPAFAFTNSADSSVLFLTNTNSSGFAVGQTLYASGIPDGTTITSISTNTNTGRIELTISTNSTVDSSSGVAVAPSQNDVINVTVNTGTLSVGSSGIMVGYNSTNGVVLNQSNTLTLGGGTLTTTGSLAAATNVNAGSTITSTFNWTGGTLTARSINATSSAWTNGNISAGALTQTNGTLAVASSGTTITGDYNLNGGTLLLPIGKGALAVTGTAYLGAGTIDFSAPNYVSLYKAGGGTASLITAGVALNNNTTNYNWGTLQSGATVTGLNGQVALSISSGNTNLDVVTTVNTYQGGAPWSQAGAWTLGIVPNGQDYFAMIGSGNTIEVDSNVAVSDLRMGSDNTLAGTGTLNLTPWSSTNNNSAATVVLAGNSTNTITAPLVLAGNAVFSGSNGSSLSIMGGLAGAGTATFSNGNFSVMGDSHLGATILSKGSLWAGFNSNVPVVTVSNGATLITPVNSSADSWSASALANQALSMSKATLAVDVTGTNFSLASDGFTNGAQSLTLAAYGAGTLSLASGNTLGGVANLQLNDSTSAIDLGGNTVALTGSNGTFSMSGGSIGHGSLTASVYNLSGGSVDSALGEGIANVIGLSSNIVTVTGSLGASTVNISGNGTLKAASATALAPTAMVNFGATGDTVDQSNTLDLTGQSLSIMGLTSTGLAKNLVTDTLGGSTLTLTGASAFAGSIGSANLGLNVASGTHSLTGVNTFSGATTIGTGAKLDLGTTGSLASTTSVSVNGGSLLLGADNQVNAAADLKLNGGTVSVGGAAGSASTVSQSFASLTLTANSIIDFNALTGSTFTITGTAALNGNSLKVYNWNSNDHLIFSLGSGSGLTDSDLGKIAFYKDAGSILAVENNGGITSGFSGNEIVPVPEPGVVITGLLMVAWMLFAGRRRIAGLLARRLA